MDLPSFSQSRKNHSNEKKNAEPTQLTFAQNRAEPASSLITGKMGIMLVLGFAALVGALAMQFKARSKGERSYVEDIHNANAGRTPTISDKNYPSQVQIPVAIAGDGTRPAIEETKGESTAPPAAEAPAGEIEVPEISERKMYTATESKDRSFREPLEPFEPLEQLDPKDEDFVLAFEKVFDEDIQTHSGYRNASDIGYASEAIYLFYRYLRTIEGDPSKLKALEQQRIETLTPELGAKGAIASHKNVMENPDAHRGQPYFFQGNLIKKFQVRYWGGDEQNNSGIQDTWMLICRDRHYQTCAVIVPHDVKHLISRDDADMSDNVYWRGLFLQRWAYLRKDNIWDAMPVYVAYRMEKIPPPQAGTNAIMLVIAGLGMVGLYFILRLVKRDSIQSENLRKALLNKRVERRKQKANSETENTALEN